MIKRPKKVKVRSFGSIHDRRRMGQARALVSLGKKAGFLRRNARTGEMMEVVGVPVNVKRTGVFVGPSVEGMDVEYVEIVSGKVSDRKPSFAR